MDVMRKTRVIFKLLRQNNSAGIDLNNNTDTDDQRKVVRKSKKSISTSMCSKRDLSVYERTLNCDRMIEELIKLLQQKF